MAEEGSWEDATTMKRSHLLAIVAGVAIFFTYNSFADDLIPVPALVDSAVPAITYPSLSLAATDKPKPYFDRCHTQQNLTKSSVPCIYGNLKSKVAIVLFGDSHALSWFPAVEKVALIKKWKMYSYTMSSCTPSTIPAWNDTTQLLMKNCAVWRTNILKSITKIKPLLIFVSGTRGFTTIDSSDKILLGESRTAAWEEGMLKSLTILKKASSRIVYIGDTPASQFNVPDCLKKSPTSITACATAYKTSVWPDWQAQESKTANSAGIIFFDPTSLICTTDPCSPLSNKYIIFSDAGHLTATFSRTLEKPLWYFVTTAIKF